MGPPEHTDRGPSAHLATPPVAVGVDVGGTKILALAVDRAGLPLGEPVQVPSPASGAALIEAVGDAAHNAAASVGGTVGSIGLGLPGFIGPDGVASQAPNLPAIIGLDVRGPLAARFAGAAVTVDNDANCAGWAARHVDAPGAANLVAVTFGTGIGGAIVLDGRLVRGANGFAGEPGHMVVDVDGPPCVCGQRGCWEMFASGSALGRLARDAVAAGDAPAVLSAAGSLDAVDGPLVSRLAAAGDAAAGRIMETYAGWAVVGLVNLVNLLDPDVIVIAGGVAAEGDALLDRIRDRMRANPTMVGRPDVVRVSRLGPTAGAIGAALIGERDAGLVPAG